MAKLLHAIPACCVIVGSSPDCATSDPAPTNAPRNATEPGLDIWSQAPRWEPQMSFQVPGFSLAHSQLFWSFGELIYKFARSIIMIVRNVRVENGCYLG